MTFFLLLLALASLLIPAVFQFVVREALYIVAWRNSANLQIGAVQGSFFEPIVFSDASLTETTPSGMVVQVAIARAEAEFNWRWRDLISVGGPRWFRRLIVEGVNGAVHLWLPSDSARFGETKAGQPHVSRIPSWAAPERLEASGVNFLFEHGANAVRIAESGCVFSQVEDGSIHAGLVTIKEQWFSRNFRNVSGVTAVHDSRAFLTHLVLEPDIEVLSLSAQIPDLIKNNINGDIKIAAFGGNLRAQVRALTDQADGGIDASGEFSMLGIAPLATFFNLSDAAGGSVKEGKFTFRGNPSHASHATASVSFTANNFQWESRQWDSLITAATLLDRRISVPEFELRQGHNQLSLNGELTLPKPGKEWWQSDFAVNLSARVENLTELSALVLPEFTYTAGRMSVDGGVRGHDQQFHGAVIVSGSGITWRDAPIEDLRAAIRLNGNELQVANLDLLNKDDFIRGRGVINIVGAKQYWGEFKASIADLAAYSAILRKPIVPEPLAGGAAIEWSGEGSAKGQSGKFLARLNKVRTLGATGAMLHPVNADLEGTYAPSAMQFSRFTISDDESSFAASVRVSAKAVSLAGIRLLHGNDFWLQGDATLPIDVWQAWPDASMDKLLSDQPSGKISLVATHLQLREAAQLTGWKWPIEGVVDGNIEAEGRLGALDTGGRIAISHGRMPLGWSGEQLTDLDATFGLSGQTLELEKFACSSAPHGSLAVTGHVDFGAIRDPSLQIGIHSDRFGIAFFPGFSLPGAAPDAAGVQVTAATDLRVSGPCSQAEVSGKAVPVAIGLDTKPDISALWRARDARPITYGGDFRAFAPKNPIPPPFVWQCPPWRNWRLEIDCESAEPVSLGFSKRSAGGDQAQLGDLTSAVKIAGTGAAPALSGSVTIRNLPVQSGFLSPIARECILDFRPGFDNDPSISLAVSGAVGDSIAYTAFADGPISHCVRFFSCAPPLTPEWLRAQLAGEQEPGEHAGAQPAWPIAAGASFGNFDWFAGPKVEPAAEP